MGFIFAVQKCRLVGGFSFGGPQRQVYSLGTEIVKLVDFCLTHCFNLIGLSRGVFWWVDTIGLYDCACILSLLLCTLVQLLKLLRTDRALLSYCKAPRSITIKEDDPMWIKDVLFININLKFLVGDSAMGWGNICSGLSGKSLHLSSREQHCWW